MAELVQSRFPQVTTRDQPVLNDRAPFGCNLMRPLAPSLFRLHQSALFEHREVLDERGELQVERRAQLTDGCRSTREVFQDFAPSRTGRGVKNIVRDCGLPHCNSSRLVG